MKWKTIDSAPKNKNILIRYYKGRKGSRSRVDGEWVVTQAHMVPLFQVTNSTYLIPENALNWYVENGHTTKPTDFVLWLDHLDRLICDTSSKKIVNLVEWWMELPEDPDHPKNG